MRHALRIAARRRARTSRGACRENEQSDHSSGRRNADCLDRDPACAEQIDEREHRAADAEGEERHHGDERDASRRRAGLLGDRGAHLDRQVAQLPDREQRGADDRRAAVEHRLVDHENGGVCRPEQRQSADDRIGSADRKRCYETGDRDPAERGDGRCRVGRGDRVEPGRQAGSEPHRRRPEG